MKLTGTRADKFCAAPQAGILGALIYGPDRGLVQERGQILASKFADDPNDAFNVTLLTADDLSSDPARLSDEMSAMSLLGGTRLIRVKLEHEKQGAAISKLIGSFDAAPQRCAARLIIEAGDMSPRSAIRKAFEAAGHFAALPCYALSVQNLERLIVDKLAAIGPHGIGIDKDALLMWAPLLEGDRGLAQNEIEKLALYKGYGETENSCVTLEDINALAAGGQAGSIDEIINAAFSGQSQIADSAYRRAVSGKVHPALILRSLQRHITRLHQAAAARDSGMSPSEAMRALRPPVFAMHQRSFENQLRAWPIVRLTRILNESLETESRVKRAGSADTALVGRLLNAISMIAARR